MGSCSDCRALLKQEAAFARRLESMPDEQPKNDVWLLLRLRTRPSTVRPLVWLHTLVATNLRKATTAAVLVVVLALGFYNVMVGPPPQPNPAPIVAVYSDDPVGGHTDAVIDSIDEM